MVAGRGREELRELLLDNLLALAGWFHVRGHYWQFSEAPENLI